MPPIEHVLALSAVLFAIGVVGIVARRSAIAMMMSLQLMLNAVALSFAAFNRMWPGADGAVALDGQVFALAILATAAAQVVVGLGVLVAWVRNRDSVDVDRARLLKW
jgi:NADH-quinone oxidoreductase subunit K